MGVSGCGKSRIGRLLAERLHWPFVEGDDLHPPANVARMRRGEPLDDAARQPWLRAIATHIAAPRPARQGLVVACSALRRAYRDTLREADPHLRLAWLDASPQRLRRRLEQRSGHFMPPFLLDSQLQTLEEPQDDEEALHLDAGAAPDVLVAAILDATH